MSVLHKLENVYLIILRLLTILLMLALLGGAVMVGVYWVKVTEEDPAASILQQTADGMPKISTDVIVKHVTEDDQGLNDVISPADPNHKTYQQIVTTLEDFAKKYSVSEEDADLESFVSTLKYTVEAQASPALKADYLQGLANTFEKALVDPKIVALIRKPTPPGRVHSDGGPDSGEEDDGLQDPMEMVGSIFQQYDAEFNRQATLLASGDSDTGSDFDKKRDHAYNMLIRWVGPFVLFVLILQMLIFGRIEQNLRHSRSTGRE